MDARLHLESCPTCEQALAESVERATAIAGLLESLETPVDSDSAKVAVRARLDRERAKESRAPRGWKHLGRAAAVLLVAAGAVTALPGSPLHERVFGGPGETVETTTGSQEAAFQGGITVPVTGGRIAVVLSGVPEGTTLDVDTSDPKITDGFAVDVGFDDDEGNYLDCNADSLLAEIDSLALTPPPQLPACSRTLPVVSPVCCPVAGSSLGDRQLDCLSTHSGLLAQSGSAQSMSPSLSSSRSLLQISGTA